mmetsp:Transcript_43414/g.84804  ORF Transcript_43414/g.84804 Transcript_43414/m.84804 type:complete len:591 (-) Transcript_43414:533-2305(-)
MQLIRHPHLLLPRPARQPHLPGPARRRRHDRARVEGLNRHVVEGSTRRVLRDEVGESVLAHALQEVAKALRLAGALRLPHVKHGLELGLEVRLLHLVLEVPPRAAVELRAAAHPHLVEVRPLPNKGELGHVGTSAPVGAPRHAHHKRLPRHPHLGEQRIDPGVEVGHTPFRLGLGQAAEGEGGARDALAAHHVDLLDGLDAVRQQQGINVGLILGVDAAEHHVLVRGEAGVEAVLVDDGAQRALDPQPVRVLDAALRHHHAEEQLAVALLMPPHPVDHAPGGEGHQRLHLLAVVRLDELAEVVDAQAVHKVLHARVGAHLAVPVVTLRREDRLQQLGKVLLGHVPERGRHLGEGRLLVVRAAHAAADKHVVALERLAVVRHDDDEAYIVDEQVDRVVAGDRDGDLELAGEVLPPVDGLLGVARDDSEPGVVQERRRDLLVQLLDGGGDGGDDAGRGGALNHVLLPVLDRRCLLSVHPELSEGGGGGGEEISDVVRGLERILVRRVREGGGGCHDVAVDVSAAAERRAPGVRDGRDDALEVGLLHTVDLPRLAGGGAEVALAPLVGDVVDGLVHAGGQLAAGHLEAEHELV